jgi:Flp pilus assembly protein TadD
VKGRVFQTLPFFQQCDWVRSLVVKKRMPSSEAKTLTSSLIGALRVARLYNSIQPRSTNPAMKQRSICPISLAVLITLGMAGSRPAGGSEQNERQYLPFAVIRSVARRSFAEQSISGVFVALRFQQRGTIAGQVVLPSGHQVNHRIRVTLSGFRIPSLTTYTDNKGRFAIPGVGDGTYTLEVQSEDGLYETVSQEVRIIYGAHPMLVINLREKPGTTQKSNTNVVSAEELDQQVPDAARKEYEKGVQASEKGKIEDAIERFKKAIAISPDYLMARNNLGVQYLKLGQWADAAQQFEAAIAINSKALNPRQNLGIALIQQKKYAQAIEHLNQAISIDSSSPTAHLYLGIASLGVDSIDQAERELSTALSTGGEAFSNAHFYLGLVYLKKGERESAIRALNAYLEKLPKGEKAPRARQLLEGLKR